MLARPLPSAAGHNRNSLEVADRIHQLRHMQRFGPGPL